VPIETWYSLPALWDPFYLVDFIGMMLLAWGAVRCRRDATPGSLAVLAAGYGWEGANYWRALFGRVQEIARGGELRFPRREPTNQSRPAHPHEAAHARDRVPSRAGADNFAGSLVQTALDLLVYESSSSGIGRMARVGYSTRNIAMTGGPTEWPT
jgi:hypothetical protein